MNMPLNPIEGPVALLGATGFLGRWLSLAPVPWRIIRARLEDTEAILQEVDGVRVVVNAAALLAGDEARLMEVNGFAPLRLLDRLPEVRWIQIGSAAEVGPPQAPLVTEDHPCAPTWAYGRSKWVASKAVAEKGLVVRPANIVGPGMPDRMLLGGALHRLRRGETSLSVTRLDAVRDYVDVRDVANAVVRLLSTSHRGIVNVSSGIGVSNEEALAALRRATGVEFEMALQSVDRGHAEVDRYVADPSRLRQWTGWSPAITLEKSLRDAWEAMV